MACRQAYVFVQRESGGAAEVQALFVPGGQFVVDGQRRGPRGQAKDGGRLAPDQLFNGVGRKLSDLPAAAQDDDFHIVPFRDLVSG